MGAPPFFSQTAWSRYTAYFQHGGQRWEAGCDLAHISTELPPMIRQYIETFRWDGETLDLHSGEQTPED